MNEQDIVFESGSYFVLRAKFGRKKTPGFAVYKSGLTHAERVASIGYSGEIGLQRARLEIERRQAKEMA